MFDKKKKAKDDARRMRRVGNLEDLLLDKGDDGGRQVPEERLLLVLPPSAFYVDEQVRKTIDPGDIEARAASMQANGQMQPIVVYPMDADGRYKIDKGECRWRAAQLIDGFELQAVVDPQAARRDKRKRMLGQIIENDQRSDLRPLELALALAELVAAGMTMEQVALELGWITGSKKPNINKVSRILSILKLPRQGRELVRDNIVVDLMTLEYLRKIHEIQPKKFAQLCELARTGKSLSRERAEREYQQCKAGGPAKQSGAAAAAKAAQPPRREAGTSAQRYPGIEVEWRGRQTGLLVFDKQPAERGFIWVRLDNDELISAGYDELRITSVSF